MPIPPILDTATFRHLLLEGLGNGLQPNNPVMVAPPANATDFSQIGGVPPPAGTRRIYFAPRDVSSIWEISSDQTSWKITKTDTP